MSESVLVVDDEEDILELVRYNLRGQGYEVICAGSGEEALEKVGQGLPDMILLDLMLPGIDGMEVAANLKKDPLTADIPIIFFTIKGDVESIVKGFEIGAADYITKPFRIGELTARVKRHLEVKRARDELKRSEQELLRANMTKERFFSIIAHELINPFNALCGFSNILSKEYDRLDEDKRKEFIRYIHESSEHGFGLLKSLLDWSRMQTGGIECRPETVDLKVMAQETVSLLAPVAWNKTIRLSSDIKPETAVYADPDMVRMIIRNLVSNAIKFTQKNGKIRVSSESNCNYEEITVSDTGIGIKDEDIKRLFHDGLSRSESGTAGEKGTGLGLLMSKEFIEKQGGQMRIKSILGKGSDISFTLPKNQNT